MRRFLSLFAVVVFFSVMMLAGCGGGTDAVPPVNPSTKSDISGTTTNPDGTATTGTTTTTVATAPGTTGYLSTVTVSIPPSTTITAQNADGSTKAISGTPSITFTAPADATTSTAGTIGLPVPAGFSTVQSASASINVSITDAPKATFSNPITIKMAAPGKPVGSIIKVYYVKEGSTTYTLIGSFTVTTANVVEFPVTNFCFFVGDPVFTTVTGGTGGAGGT